MPISALLGDWQTNCLRFNRDPLILNNTYKITKITRNTSHINENNVNMKQYKYILSGTSSLDPGNRFLVFKRFKLYLLYYYLLHYHILDLGSSKGVLSNHPCLFVPKSVSQSPSISLFKFLDEV